MELLTDGRKCDFPVGELADEDLDWLRENGEIRELEPGEEILTAGEEARHVVFCLGGQMRWLLVNPMQLPHHSRAKNSACWPCDFGGDWTFLYPGRAGATLRADEVSKVLCVSHERLREHCNEDLGFSARFHRMIAKYCVLRALFERTGGAEHAEMKAGSERALARLLETGS